MIFGFCRAVVVFSMSKNQFSDYDFDFIINDFGKQPKIVLRALIKMEEKKFKKTKTEDDIKKKV